MDLTKEINRLKEEQDAVILAHYYQIGEVQDIADYVGDSFALSKLAKELPQKVIVFCGVHFMGESAKILSPEKTVLVPDLGAGCPMADMVTLEDVQQLRKQHPHAVVVCYVNSSAEVKALSDICCTSSNAVRLVRGLEADEIIFIPDQNLGSYVAQQVPEKKIILHEGYCITHHRMTLENVLDAKKTHPNAKLAMHPECRQELTVLSDMVGSTAEIIDYVSQTDAPEFIIGTEMGVIHEIQKRNPHKKLYLMNPGLVCPNMKKVTLDKVHQVLANHTGEMKLDKQVMDKARLALEKMLLA